MSNYLIIRSFIDQITFIELSALNIIKTNSFINTEKLDTLRSKIILNSLWKF